MVPPTTGQGECWHLSGTGVLTAVPAMRHASARFLSIVHCVSPACRQRRPSS